jgi:MarR family transcriptional regulator, organic hydroperoxide resistance regulator
VSSAIPDLLSQVEHLVSRRVEAALGPDGPTLDQWRVLAHLADGAGHPMSEIAEFALVPAPSLTRLIDRMATDGLVYRRADERDRRRVLVQITRRGRALHRATRERVALEHEALLADADPAEARRLLGLLGELTDRIR